MGSSSNALFKLSGAQNAGAVTGKLFDMNAEQPPPPPPPPPAPEAPPNLDAVKPQDTPGRKAQRSPIAQQRAAAGMAGTVKTSSGGVQSPALTGGKSLLGQ